MNKRQLIVAWITGLFVSLVCLNPTRYSYRRIDFTRTILYIIPILIIGILLIITLRNDDLIKQIKIIFGRIKGLVKVVFSEIKEFFKSNSKKMKRIAKREIIMLGIIMGLGIAIGFSSRLFPPPPKTHWLIEGFDILSESEQNDYVVYSEKVYKYCEKHKMKIYGTLVSHKTSAGFGILTNNIDASDNSLTVNTGHTLPAVGTFILTIWNASRYPNPANDPNAEVIVVSNYSGVANVYDIGRAKIGTNATGHLAGSRCEMLYLDQTKAFSPIVKETEVSFNIFTGDKLSILDTATKMTQENPDNQIVYDKLKKISDKIGKTDKLNFLTVVSVEDKRTPLDKMKARISSFIEDIFTRDKITGFGGVIFFFGYPVLLFIRLIIWAIKSLKTKT